MSRTDLIRARPRWSAARIEATLEGLASQGEARFEDRQPPGRGRVERRWFASDVGNAAKMSQDEAALFVPGCPL